MTAEYNHNLKDCCFDYRIDPVLLSPYDGTEVVKRIHQAHPELLGYEIAYIMKWWEYGKYARKSVAQGLRDIGYGAKFIKEPMRHRIEITKYPLNSDLDNEWLEILWGGGEY